MSDTWNPAQYALFAKERNLPFQELLGLIRARAGLRAVDLGCGTGELTARLHRELGLASTVGIDSSMAMLERSQAFEEPGLRFEAGDLRQLTGEYDLIFSYAALQWVDDHPTLFAGLRDRLRPEGQLAVQLPANFDHPAHRVAHEVAGQEPFLSALGGYSRELLVLAPEQYCQLLWRLGFREQHVSLRVYPHELESREDVLEWVKGTLLTDYQRRLGPEVFADFLKVYAERLRSELADERPFLYPFKRILLWGAL